MQYGPDESCTPPKSCMVPAEQVGGAAQKRTGPRVVQGGGAVGCRQYLVAGIVRRAAVRGEVEPPFSAQRTQALAQAHLVRWELSRSRPRRIVDCDAAIHDILDLRAEVDGDAMRSARRRERPDLHLQIRRLTRRLLGHT